MLRSTIDLELALPSFESHFSHLRNGARVGGQTKGPGGSRHQREQRSKVLA